MVSLKASVNPGNWLSLEIYQAKDWLFSSNGEKFIFENVEKNILVGAKLKQNWFPSSKQFGSHFRRPSFRICFDFTFFIELKMWWKPRKFENIRSKTKFFHGSDREEWYLQFYSDIKYINWVAQKFKKHFVITTLRFGPILGLSHLWIRNTASEDSVFSLWL